MGLLLFLKKNSLLSTKYPPFRELTDKLLISKIMKSNGPKPNPAIPSESKANQLDSKTIKSLQAPPPCPIITSFWIPSHGPILVKKTNLSENNLFSWDSLSGKKNRSQSPLLVKTIICKTFMENKSPLLKAQMLVFYSAIPLKTPLLYWRVVNSTSIMI